MRSQQLLNSPDADPSQRSGTYAAIALLRLLQSLTLESCRASGSSRCQNPWSQHLGCSPPFPFLCQGLLRLRGCRRSQAFGCSLLHPSLLLLLCTLCQSQYLQCLLPYRRRRHPSVRIGFHALVLLTLSHSIRSLVSTPRLPIFGCLWPHKRCLHLNRHVLFGLGPEPVTRLLRGITHGHLLHKRAD